MFALSSNEFSRFLKYHLQIVEALRLVISLLNLMELFCTLRHRYSREKDVLAAANVWNSVSAKLKAHLPFLCTCEVIFRVLDNEVASCHV